MHNFEYREPDTLEEALALLGELGEEAKIVAGGTALVIMLNQRLLMPSHLISLRKLRDIDQIESSDGTLQLGALATLRAVETSPVVKEQSPVLAETYAQVATLRIRNMATVGGSLAHADPNQDPPVILMALDARVGLASAGGRREVVLDEFFTDYYETVVRPDELVTRVVVPRAAPHTGSTYLKFLPRTSEDYATVGVAARVSLEPDSGVCQDCRLVLGGVGATPLRAREAEDLLKGQKSTPELLEAVGAAARQLTDPVSDSRGSAQYKRAMTGVFVGRAIEQAWERALA
jgi:carbon-monoxide dehydrogenase medium subunit